MKRRWILVQGSSGLLSITGTADGESVRCGYGVTDVTAGLFSVIGILLALRARERTGIGQYVDVSMLDSMISTMSSNYMSYLGSGDVPTPMGTAFPTVVPYCACSTRRIVRWRLQSAAKNSGRLSAARSERPDLERRPEYATQNAERIRNRETPRTCSLKMCSAHVSSPGLDYIDCRLPRFPASLVRDFEEVAQHPQSSVGGGCSRKWTIPPPAATASPVRR